MKRGGAAPTAARSTRADQLRAVEAEASRCTRCELHERATQTVFGAGRATAKLMFVGEQPGDKEDLAGEPFVGPAGAVLDRALGELGIARKSVYLTNVVKHFRWEASGKRRIHKTPGVEHVRICSAWLEAEIAIVRPEILVCLGAVATRAVLGPKFKLTRERGTLLTLERPGLTLERPGLTLERPGLTLERPGRVLATVHPSSVLRSDDREAAYAAFLSDLEVAVKAMRVSSPASPRRSLG
jgi:uracil-DNA glycosylase